MFTTVRERVLQEVINGINRLCPFDRQGELNMEHPLYSIYSIQPRGTPVKAWREVVADFDKNPTGLTSQQQTLYDTIRRRYPINIMVFLLAARANPNLKPTPSKPKTETSLPAVFLIHGPIEPITGPAKNVKYERMVLYAQGVVTTEDTAMATLEDSKLHEANRLYTTMENVVSTVTRPPPAPHYNTVRSFDIELSSNVNPELGLADLLDMVITIEYSYDIQA